MALPPALLHESLWVADIVYTPLETELLRHARERGCRTLDGGAMAVFQAAYSLELFTGLEPDIGRMLAHFAELTDAGGSVAAQEQVVRVS
jgi:shikimate dehydrogenase